MTDNPKISVVIPVYNEMATIEEILLRVQNVDLDKEIVIVDDGSKDGTRNFLQSLAESAKAVPAQINLPRTGKVLETGRIRIFFQEKNQGKGAALRRGFQESKGDIVIIQDADTIRMTTIAWSPLFSTVTPTSCMARDSSAALIASIYSGIMWATNF